jgi:adenylate kinase
LTYNPPPEDIKARLTQRSDDTAEKLTVRLQVFHAQSKPIIKHYAQSAGVHVLKIDGTKPSHEVFQAIHAKLSED